MSVLVWFQLCWTGIVNFFSYVVKMFTYVPPDHIAPTSHSSVPDSPGGVASTTLTSTLTSPPGIFTSPITGTFTSCSESYQRFDRNPLSHSNMFKRDNFSGYGSSISDKFRTPVSQALPESRNPYSESSPRQNNSMFLREDFSSGVHLPIHQIDPVSSHVGHRHLSMGSQSHPTCPSFSSTMRRQLKPDTYDGESDWLDYMRHFEKVSIWNGWNDEEKAMQLAMSMTGIARCTLADLPVGITENFCLLNEALRQRFNPEGREVAYKLEFRQRNRKPDESFMDFGYALRRLAIRAFPGIPTDAREELVLDQFITGLDGIEMRKHVQFSHPKRLDEAITLAVEYETFFRTQKTKKPVAAVASPQDSSSLVSSSEKDEYLKLMESMQSSLNSLKSQLGKIGNGHRFRGRRNLGDVQCFNCQQFGHMARNCGEKKKCINQGESRIVEQPSTTSQSLNC